MEILKSKCLKILLSYSTWINVPIYFPPLLACECVHRYVHQNTDTLSDSVHAPTEAAAAVVFCRLTATLRPAETN